MDFVTDQSCRHINRLNQLAPEGVPAYVKSASLDPEDTAKLADHQFADPDNREFPIDEPGHVYLSYAYLKSAGISKPATLRKVKAAAKLLKLDHDLEHLDELFGAAQNKSASAATPAAAIVLSKDDKTQYFFPIDTPTSVEDSIQKVACERHRLPLPLWVDACRNIVKAADDLKMAPTQVPALIRRYGEPRIVDVEHVKFAAERRFRDTGDAVYEDLAASIDACQADEGWDKAAEAWFQADLQNDITYNRDVEDPYQIIFSGTTKAAANKYLDQFFLLAGTPVPVTELARLSKSALEKHLPKNEVTDLVELVKVASEKGGAYVEQVIASKNNSLQRALLALLIQEC